MAMVERDIYIRNHVMGVLATYQERGMNSSSMGGMASDITEAVIEADNKWHRNNCCDQILAIAGSINDEDNWSN